jgi:hypothetical protein
MRTAIHPDFSCDLTTPEQLLVRSIWGGVEDPIQHDSPIWANDFGEYEPVTPGVLICYLRNEEICQEWPCTLINHIRFLLEELPENIQALARTCWYFWERTCRPKVNWKRDGF